MSTDTPGNPGVSIGLLCAFHEVLRQRFPNRAAVHEQMNKITYHLAEAERIYETLPEVPGEKKTEADE